MKTKFTFKRALTLVLAVMMLVTAMPVGVLAEPGAGGTQNEKKYTDDDYSITYNDKIIRKADYINKVGNLPIEPKKNENAKEFVKNPDMPKLYTVHSDFKVQRGDDLVISYQPYIATAGDDEYEYTDQNGDKQKVLSDTEKKRIKKQLTFPTLDGYTSATPNRGADITYDFIKGRAKTHELVDDEYKGHYDYIYTPIPSKVNVKHLFQDIKDFSKYTNPDGTIIQGNTIIYDNGRRKENATKEEINEHERITSIQGVTGTSLTIQPLPDDEIKGYVPESTILTTQVPENPDNFVVELRYNLAHYSIKYDTTGGTEIPARTLYYKQVIPKIANADIPTKVGGTFQGWKPSVDLKTKDGKTFKANEIIAVGTGQAIEKLDNNLIMPASNVTFTAVWKDNEKANYAVQFWAEKADHDDNASLSDKYDYIGTRVYKDQATGSRPDLDNEPVKDIVFPDLDQARLQKIWAGEKFYGDKYLYLNKFFVYNKDLTHDQNKDPKNVNLVKSVDSTGRTVYNIYYDRQVYDLYFTKSNVLPAENTFYPEIYVPDGNGGAKKAGGPGNPYHFSARFNQLMLGWPNDAMQTKGFDKEKQSYGWGPNYGYPQWPLHLDTPPYRLNADEFLDMPNYDNWGGYVSQIDKGDGSTIDVNNDPRYKNAPYKALSFGIKQDKKSMPHHMDFWMDGFKDGETIIRYDLYRTKADTNSLTYGHRYSKVQGFTPYGSTIEEGNEEHGRITADDIDALNEERGEITPYPKKDYTDTLGFNNALGKMHFISAFFNNADEFGDPLPGIDAFDTNGYIRFKYKRNKYPLRFNYDPSEIKDDSEFGPTNELQTFYEFPLKALSPEVDTGDEYKKENPANLLDNPENLQTLGLTDLVFTDTDGKLKVKRPDNLSDQMVFKGWALDPAGTKLIWENPGEKMPSHPVNLYAKWGEPDYQWKVTFDPNGGALSSIDEAKVTQKRKTIQEGDKGQEETKTFAQKEKNEGDKQVFTVIQRQKLVEPKKPTKKGYDFMGWEVIRYKKDATTGDYTSEIDTSYRDTYKVPELYSFGNDVVSPVYLKAIWVKSDVVDIESHHHFLDNDYKEVKQEIQPLKDRRVGSYLAAVGSRQNDERILVPKDEWDKLKENNETKLTNSMTYAEYMKLDKEHPRVNSYSQQIRIEPKQIPDPNDPNKLIDNPDAKLNQFHFYYRPFRQRECKVNYLDERGRKEVEEFFNDPIKGSKAKFNTIKNNPNLTDKQKSDEYKSLLEANRKAFKKIRDKYSIIDQEAVKNGKRHFDARNYRPIAGWVLDDKPQQQLFFDINEDTNAFFGINETGFDEVNFFYKDVRVIEVPKDGKTPYGYVRVTFRAADGGSFTDKDGKAVKELYYDVIKGLKSDFIPVPQVLEEGKEKEKGKYYITPDNGKRFIEWDKQKLLNDNTIIEQDYTFTAQYDWSDLHASSKGLVKTEAFNDPNSTWTNSFAPTIDELKAQIVKTDANGNEVALPADATVTIVDDAGNELTQDAIYEKVKEMSALDTNELVRTVVFKAKVKFTGNQADKTLDIPVKIYKNVYEALTNGDMPKVLKDATTAPDGDLVNVTGKYVKVTVQPTNKPSNKDAKIYYVNPNAWVKINEVDISTDASNLGFTKWTADKDNQNEESKANGVFDFDKRHKFTEDTVITPNFSDDVIKQTDPNKNPDVPGDFVKVIVEKTDKADLKTGEEQTQTFWVNPTKEVTIPVSKPNGKTIPTSGTNQQIAYIFKDWTSEETPSRTWTDTITAKFTEAVTTITANYTEAENIIPYNPDEPITKPDGYVRVKFDADEGLALSNVQYYYVKQNSGVKLSDLAHPTVEAKTGYEFNNKWDKADATEIGDKDLTVTAQANKLDNVIPDDGNPNTKPKDYVEVTFVIKTGDESKGSIDGTKKFFVKPNEYVKIDPPETKANTGYEFGAWDKDTKIPTVYNGDTTIIGSFNGLNDVIPNTNPDGSANKQPDGYKTVTFVIDPETGGEIEDGEVTVYYVNPDKDVTVPQPKTQADTGYEFEKWNQDTTTATKYTTDTTVKGTFKKLQDIIPSNNGANAQPEGYVTVTFTKGDHGSSISGETVYYVNPQADPAKTLGDSSIVKPTVKADTGYTFKGWDKKDTTFINSDITVNADYTDVGDVIPKLKDDGTENDIPAGYIEVTFDTAANGTITGSTTGETKKVVYVRPNTAVVLKGFEPEVEANTGYKFSGWNVNLSKATIYNSGDVITAQYNSLNDIKTTPDPNYVQVEFRTGPEGTLLGDTELWVIQNKEVTLPAPIVTSKPGHTFKGWDRPLTVTLTKSQEPYIINAQYYNGDNIIPEIDASGKINNKPDGYVTVTFRADDNGKLEGDKDVIRYFVNPDAGIMIVDTINNAAKEIAVPMTKADANYVFDKWFEDIDKTKPITTDLEYVARFKLNKVTLTYDAGGANGAVPIPVIVDHGTKLRLAPATNLSKTDAKFAGWMIGDHIYQVGEEVELTKDATAVAQWTTDKEIISYDPKEPMTRPDTSYVRVTFEADNGLSLTEQKAYYVKKDAGITLAQLTKPNYDPNTGYVFKEWDKADTDTITTDLLVTAKATKLETVIPERDKNGNTNAKPKGYKEVSFVVKTDDKDKGSLVGNTKFYVNPNEYVTITPPKTEASTGFEFGAWSPDPSIPTVYTADTTIIEASFNGLKYVIPKTDDSEKPAGYVTVTFEIEGKGGSIAPKETTVYYVKPNTDVTVPQPKTIPETGYEFDKWDKDTSVADKYTNDPTIIKGRFKKLDDIIPSTDPRTGNTNAKPGGYITVTFDKGEHGEEITGQRVYYVNPNAGKTIGHLGKPTVKPETGWKQKTGSDAWNPIDATEINGPSDIVVKAQYDAIDDVIPATDANGEPNAKPDGYITVTFSTETNGKIKDTTDIKTKVVYVKPNKAVALKGFDPEVTPNTGYDFARWDTTIERAIQYEDNDVIKALYNQIGSIIPKENDQTKKPDGYVTVTFDKGTNGKEITGTTVYYVDPNREVNLPAPTVKPAVGYEFKKWDKELTQTFNEDATITAEYKELDNIIPNTNPDGSANKKPDGYVKVTFIGEHGTLEKPTVYYVKPNTEIWLRDSIFNKMIDKGNPDIGYTSRGGEWYEGDAKVTTRVTITEDKTFTYKFAPLKDVIEKTSDDQEAPNGYVTVTLIPTDKATDKTKTKKVYFVNPLKKVTIPSFEPTGKEETDANGNKYTYVFNTWTSIRGVLGAWPNGSIEGIFTQDTDIEAKYTKPEDLAPIAKKGAITQIKVEPKPEDLIKNVYDKNDPNNKENLPDGTKFEYTTDGKPDVSKLGSTTAKVKVTYPNGNTVIVEVPITVVDNVIPQDGEEKPKNVPDDFVKVTFVPTDKGTMEGAKIFWVKPNEDVKIPVKDPVGVGYNIFKEWKLGEKADGKVFKKDEAKKFNQEETIITATYTDSDNIIPFDPKADNPMVRPEGYVKVTFEADLGLKLSESKAYYVKKNVEITLGILTKPKYQEASGYKFDKWDKDDTLEIKDQDIVVTALAKFTPSKPDDRPYPEVIYRDKIVEKEKIVEKIVKVGDNDEMQKEIRYMQGYNGKFRPYDGLTRAEAAQILANALKADGYKYDANYDLSYTDVGNKWYTDAIRVVTQANVFQGYSDGTFRPQSKITRAEWVATLRRFQDLKEANGNAMMLRSGHWATAEVEAAYEAGWLGVYQDGTAKFDADKPITRQEVAYVSNRAFKRALDKVYLKRSVNTLLTYKDINPSMPLYEDILCASNTLLTDGRYYKANTIILDNLTFNIVTDMMSITQKKFQYNVIR